MKKLFASILFFFLLIDLTAQSTNKNPVYIDNRGVLRWARDKKEATFFGVNYTVPFAYGYRSHKVLDIDIEKAIDADVYHMARLGLNAFRVHIWDVEISDSLGNLLENEHLRLFDYLIKKLKERNIKILITPIAFWGNGYPEKDEKTNGFSSVYGKGNSVVLEAAIKAQENYLKQFFIHVNLYTKLSYKDDPDVIAAEINNEPHHSGPKEKTTEYINRLANAIKSTGWSKPIFYNISESPAYADAVVKANIDGYSFQWYPTGLVAGHEIKGNFLPNVDQYYIPFLDTIPAFKNRARMVYEFDAGDVMQPIMYPAMARSFRTAGFQWVTQFAYDPMYTAHANTEYQTHYLNLAYTPSKAISLLIASKVFHKLPRSKSYGVYPKDTLFDVFRVSYREQLSEMNSEEEFYYSNSTSTNPKDISKLKHIAGVGNSPIVQYEGTGAYFLDKLSDGIWRLEVMPDVIPIRDPFEKASPRKEVAHIEWNSHSIKISLQDMGSDYLVGAIAPGNAAKVSPASSNSIKPGVYLIYDQKQQIFLSGIKPAVDFYAPLNSRSETALYHSSLAEVSPNKPFSIFAKITGVDPMDKISVELHNSSNKWKTLTMSIVSKFNYSADVAADIVTPGLINYRIMIKKANGDMYTFPGGFKGDPYFWNEYRNETWQTFVAAAETPLTLFDPTNDRGSIMFYNTDWRNNKIEYVTAYRPNQLVLKATMTKRPGKQMMGWQSFIKEKIKGRESELLSFNKVVIVLRSYHDLKCKLSLITNLGQAFSAYFIPKKEQGEIEIPFNSLQKDSSLLLPRPYPGFLPLRFESASILPFDITQVEKLELTFEQGTQAEKQFTIEVESIFLKK